MTLFTKKPPSKVEPRALYCISQGRPKRRLLLLPVNLPQKTDIQALHDIREIRGNVPLSFLPLPLRQTGGVFSR